MPALWWLDQQWRSFVAVVAALDRRAQPAAAPFRMTRTVDADATFRPPVHGEPKTAVRQPDDAGLVTAVQREATVSSGPSPVPANPKPATGRKPDWLLETHPEPPGAVALAAHLDARRAQAAGLRALLFARQRRYAEAEEAFAQAATLDPALDLTALDGFWDLGRGAHEAAVRAYEAAGRARDAMLLRATLDGRYRPRLVRTA